MYDHPNFVLLNTTSKTPVYLDGKVSFQGRICSSPSPAWFDENEAITVPGIYCVYFYAMFQAHTPACALFINECEVKGTRCTESICGSATLVITASQPYCKISLKVLDFDSIEENSSVSSAMLLISDIKLH